MFYFEIGNRKYSLYGRTVYDYTYHDDTEADVARQNTTYMQNFTQATRTDKHSWLGELLFKWSMTPKDYFAAHGYADISRDKTHGEGTGLFTQAEDEAYAFSSNGNDKSLIATTSLYYKHSFSSSNTLEVRLAYNFNRDNYSETRTEQYGGNTTGRETLFKSRRHSGSLMIDYARDFKNGTYIAFGSHTSLKRDNIANRAALFSPAFVHKELNQYVYGDPVQNKLSFNSPGGAYPRCKGLGLRLDGERAHKERDGAHSNDYFVRFDSVMNIRNGRT